MSVLFVIVAATCGRTYAAEYIQKDFSALFAAIGDDFESKTAAKWKEQLKRPHPTVATIRKYFDDAAIEFGVPSEVLQAIGQVEANWTQLGPSVDQGWGVMHLVQNSYRDTLGEAAKALGSDPQLLKDDAKQNIRGAAALLARYAGSDRASFTRLEDWFAAVKLVVGLKDDDLQELEAMTIFGVILKGSVSTTLWGEKIRLLPHENVNVKQKATRGRGDIAPMLTDTNNGIVPMSTDYGPALWNSADSSNWGSGRTHTIDTWVNHWIGVGTYAGTIQWFRTPVGQGGRTAPKLRELRAKGRGRRIFLV